MKNKKAIYLLVPLVVLVWGLVLYKVLDLGKEEHNKGDGELQITLKKENKSSASDTFTIIADYRDPFLGIVKRKVMISENPVPVKKSLPKIPPLPPVQVKWPVITYGGIIRNQHSNEEIAIVTVGEREGLLTINEELMGITLKRIFNKDSIEVSYQENSKVIRKR